MARRFSKLPSWWLRDGTCLQLEGGNTSGPSIAAFKCAMAISTKIDFSSRKVKLSFTDLQTLTGLSRPMVSRGIALLEALEILNVDRSSYTNQYQLTVIADDENWAKLPVDAVIRRLPHLPNRGSVGLAALKVYMQLVAVRPNQSLEVAITHERLRDLTGIQKNQVRPALDVLFSHSLIRITQNEYQGNKHLHNVYTIMGLTM